jgi:ABC-type branched-subunit amino acid transport system ATPase component
MLNLASVSAFYSSSQVLQDVSFEVDAGEVVCLLGRNGAGKSTTIAAISGFVPVREGSIGFGGKDMTRWPIEKRANHGLALVPQGRRVFPLLTVEENLLIGAKPKRGDWTLSRVYAFFPRLVERRMSLARHLSGGEQQMVAIGRALMSNPSLVLMDEPSEGLAPLVIQDVYDVIGQLAREGMSILLVEHSLDLAIALASRIYILDKGEIVWQSRNPAELTDALRVKYLGVG